MNAELFERLFLGGFIEWLVETHPQDSSRDVVVWTESLCDVHNRFKNISGSKPV